MPVSIIRAGGHVTPLMQKTLDVLNNVPEGSFFKTALDKIKVTGGNKVRNVNKDPFDVAKIVHSAIMAKQPKRIYSVNESVLYKFLNLAPRSLKELIVIRALK
jgi:hypothetical protein